MSQVQVSNFFYFVRYVYNAYKGIKHYYDEDNHIVTYSEECHQVFDRFVGYLERCDFSNKKSDKFLCANWKVNKNDLLDLWVQQFGKQKNAATFRSQLSTLSRELYGLFGDEWAGDFMENKCDDIRSRLDLLESQAINFSIVAPPDLVKKITFRAYKNYSLEDLREELEFLHTYNSEQVRKRADLLDVDKLAYIKDKLNEPLCLNGKYNEPKAQVLNQIKKKVYAPISEPIERVLSPKQMKIITDVVDNNGAKESNEARLDELKDFMYRAYTLEGLRDYLSQFSSEDIKRTFKELQNIVR